jgi:hypothetical protein
VRHRRARRAAGANAYSFVRAGSLMLSGALAVALLGQPLTPGLAAGPCHPIPSNGM